MAATRRLPRRPCRRRDGHAPPGPPPCAVPRGRARRARPRRPAARAARARHARWSRDPRPRPRARAVPRRAGRARARADRRRPGRRRRPRPRRARRRSPRRSSSASGERHVRKANHAVLLSSDALRSNVRARILGSAAGGGFPQWNCRCPTCQAARTGAAARPRTQSSLAIRGADGPWLLANASPDLRQQLEALPDDGATGIRAAPIAGVLLTDAEIDHTAGLLLLRESSTPIRVYGTEPVRQALTEGYPVLPVLASYCGVDWRTLEPGCSVAIDG